LAPPLTTSNRNNLPNGTADVVNGGAKTPLDVAMACELNSRKDGTSDTQYKKVISYFHDTIVEEAEEFEQRINS
jgi:hypothetical protein